MKQEGTIVLMMVSGLLLIFSREINWILILYPVIYGLKVIRNFKKYVLIFSCSVAIPLIPYLFFLVVSGTFPMLLLKYEILVGSFYERTWRALWPVLFLMFGLMPFFITRVRREDLPLLFFLMIEIVSRIFAPGPWWPYYFETMVIPVGMLAYKATKRKSILFLPYVISLIMVIYFSFNFFEFMAFLDFFDAPNLIRVYLAILVIIISSISASVGWFMYKKYRKWKIKRRYLEFETDQVDGVDGLGELVPNIENA
ncbi:MAG: hypothetical protein ACTSUE_13665 [Promethearchaeota archaeon]